MNSKFYYVFQGKKLGWELIFKKRIPYLKNRQEEVLLDNTNLDNVLFTRKQEAIQPIRDYMNSTYGMPSRLTDRYIGDRRYEEVKLKFKGEVIGVLNMHISEAEDFKRYLRAQKIKCIN